MAANLPQLSERLRRLVCSICDYRKTHKKNFRHPLPDMLILTVLARLCGCSTRKETIHFGEQNLQLLQSAYGILPKGVPSEPTLCRMEKGIDEEAFARLYSEFARLLTADIDPPSDGRPVIKAIDGKFMRGTTLANGRWPDIVSIYDVGRGIATDTEACQEKSNEIKATPKLLERASFEPGTVVTADAMNCQTEIIDLILKKKAHYFIALKANQRTIRYSVEDTLPGMTPDDECHSVETGHGRIHERRCRVFYGVDRISGIDKFSSVCAIVEVTTHTTHKATGKETSQTRYYITSMRGSAQLMDYISRKHWGIENNLHWELDTLQGQDATKRKYPKAARNLDTIQKIVHDIIAYTARKKLPDEISSSKEKMKTQFKSLMTMASFNIGFALSMMAL